MRKPNIPVLGTTPTFQALARAISNSVQFSVVDSQGDSKTFILFCHFYNYAVVVEMDFLIKFAIRGFVQVCLAFEIYFKFLYVITISNICSQH